MIMNNRPASDVERPVGDQRFQPGEVVRHRRYGYRGVVVDCDLACEADESWYQSNQTQPQRDQPWYHVLVDSSSTTTYAAQTSLEAEESPTPITHPYLEYFFSDFDGESYIRNDRPWPRGDEAGI